jgi:oxygen-independent coproporphyrinogen III oxidase
MGIAVYIHIPFCWQKCNYCDFPSQPVVGLDVDAYLTALDAELAIYREELSQDKVSTLFIGGGTPSLLSLKQLEELFRCLDKNLLLAPKAEVTMEVNPGTVDLAKLRLLKERGVNRLSLGVQSFDEALLKRLGRIHSVGQAEDAFNLARQVGFSNINLDLMNGLPEQSLANWQITLNRALTLGPEHMSVYGLIIEEGTPFGSEWECGALHLPQEEVRADMAVWAAECLEEHGFKHYEISNYAKPERECRHNKVYWDNLPYLGFGVGATSYLHGIRRTNKPNIAEYIGSLSKGEKPPAENDIPGPADEMAETMFLGLRMLDGVSRETFQQRFGVSLDSVYEKPISGLVDKGLLEDIGTGIRLSKKGIWIANEVFCEFIS